MRPWGCAQKQWVRANRSPTGPSLSVAVCHYTAQHSPVPKGMSDRRGEWLRTSNRSFRQAAEVELEDGWSERKTSSKPSALSSHSSRNKRERAPNSFPASFLNAAFFFSLPSVCAGLKITGFETYRPCLRWDSLSQEVADGGRPPSLCRSAAVALVVVLTHVFERLFTRLSFRRALT